MKYTERYTEKGLAMLREREAAMGIYHVGNWSFFKMESGEFQAKYDCDNGDIQEYKYPCLEWTEDFSEVIAEAKKNGYNVDAEFLKEQVETILCGYKVTRFLPDRSGQVFSPVDANGIIFRFSPIAEDSREYAC